MAKELTGVKRVLESTIEAELRRRVEALGGICDKARVIGRRGYFDRIIILPGPRIIFCEIKRPTGGRVSAHQSEYASRYEALGVEVAIIRNREDIDALLKK